MMLLFAATSASGDIPALRNCCGCGCWHGCCGSNKFDLEIDAPALTGIAAEPTLATLPGSASCMAHVPIPLQKCRPAYVLHISSILVCGLLSTTQLPFPYSGWAPELQAFYIFPLGNVMVADHICMLH